MAKQTGPFIFEKTYGMISFYRVGDMGLVRKKSNLTKERWETDPAFAGSRKCAGLLGLACKMASPLYKTLPKERRKATHRRQLIGLANKLLNAGFNTSQVQKVLELALHNLWKNLEQKQLTGKSQRQGTQKRNQSKHQPQQATYNKQQTSKRTVLPTLFTYPGGNTIFHNAIAAPVNKNAARLPNRTQTRHRRRCACRASATVTPCNNKYHSTPQR